MGIQENLDRARRINPDELMRHDRLKNIAGLLRQLSYRDMQTLAAKLRHNMPKHSDPDSMEIAEALLETADAILETKL